jgi:hypothetical protein
MKITKLEHGFRAYFWGRDSDGLGPRFPLLGLRFRVFGAAIPNAPDLSTALEKAGISGCVRVPAASAAMHAKPILGPGLRHESM